MVKYLTEEKIALLLSKLNIKLNKDKKSDIETSGKAWKEKSDIWMDGRTDGWVYGWIGGQVQTYLIDV